MKKKPPSTSEPGTTTVDVASIIGELHAPFENADAMRADALANLATARTARRYMLQRTRDTLAAELGHEAPQVTELDASIKANAELASSLSTLSGLAAKPAPTAAADETIVHGFVRDAASKPVAGVKLALAHPKGDVLASTSSSMDGHFVLRHKAASKEEVPGKLEVRVHDKRQPSPIEVERGGGVAILVVHLED